MSHPGSKPQGSSNGGVIAVTVLGILVVGGLVLTCSLKSCAAARDHDRAREVCGERLSDAARLFDYRDGEVKRLYAFGDTYVVRLDGETPANGSYSHYLRIPDYTYGILLGHEGDLLGNHLGMIQKVEYAAESSRPVGLDGLKRHAVYTVWGKYTLAVDEKGSRVVRHVILLTVRGSEGKAGRVTEGVFNVLVQGHTIRDQLPAIEAVLKE